MHSKKSHQAFSLVEIVLSGALLMVMVLGMASASGYVIGVQKDKQQESKADLLLQEAVQATNNIKDGSFAALSAGNHGLGLTAGRWIFNGTQDITDGYTRQVTLADVDGTTKDATFSIKWTARNGTTKTITAATRYFDWERTVYSWANPALDSTFNLTGTTGATFITASGTLGISLRNATSNNIDLINLTNPLAPAQYTQTSASGTPVEAAISGNYVYVSSNTAAQNLQVFNVTTRTAPTKVAQVNLTGTGLGKGFAIYGSYLYLGRATTNKNDFNIINITTPTAPTSSGGVSITGNPDIFDVAVSGNYAFCASSSTTGELAVVDITSKTAPVYKTALDIPSTTTGKFVKLLNATTLLLSKTGENILYIINISNPLVPSIITTYNAGGLINGIDVGGSSGNLVFLATANATQKLQVVNLTNPATPVLYGIYNAPTTLNSVGYISGTDLAVELGTNTALELAVIKPN